MDPLLAARGDVVPRVIDAIPTIPMPMRRYAIAFLANQGDRRALPLLRQMLANSREQDTLRGEALYGIAMIDPIEGRKLASSYYGQGDYLGFRATEVSRGQFFERRKRLAATENVIEKKLGF